MLITTDYQLVVAQWAEHKLLPAVVVVPDQALAEKYVQAAQQLEISVVNAGWPLMKTYQPLVSARRMLLDKQASVLVVNSGLRSPWHLPSKVKNQQLLVLICEGVTLKDRAYWESRLVPEPEVSKAVPISDAWHCDICNCHLKDPSKDVIHYSCVVGGVFRPHLHLCMACRVRMGPLEMPT